MKKGDFLDELLKDFNWVLYYTMRIRICQRCWLPDVKFGGADQGKSKKKSEIQRKEILYIYGMATEKKKRLKLCQQEKTQLVAVGV